MEKVINSYETLFITDVTAGEEATKATVTKFTDIIAKNAEIVEVTEWGKRRLAYPINDMPEGYYTIVTFKSEPAFPAELDRLYNIDESIMRSLVLKLEYEAVAKAVEAPVVEEAPAAEAAEIVAEEPAAPAEEPAAPAEEPAAPAEEATEATAE